MEKETTILISELRQRKSAACQQLLATYGPMVFRMVQRIVPLRSATGNTGHMAQSHCLP